MFRRVAGLPVLPRLDLAAQRRRTISRCQRKTVSGVTSSRSAWRRAFGITASRVASSARSAQSRFGRRGCRRCRTASWWRRIKISAIFHASSRRDSRSHEVIRVIRRKTNRRHMTGDHHGQAAGMATLLVRALDGILGTHRSLTGRLVSCGLGARVRPGQPRLAADRHPRRQAPRQDPHLGHRRLARRPVGLPVGGLVLEMSLAVELPDQHAGRYRRAHHGLDPGPAHPQPCGDPAARPGRSSRAHPHDRGPRAWPHPRPEQEWASQGVLPGFAVFVTGLPAFLFGLARHPATLCCALSSYANRPPP